MLTGPVDASQAEQRTRQPTRSYVLPVTPSSSDPISLKVSIGTTATGMATNAKAVESHPQAISSAMGTGTNAGSIANSRDRQRSGTITADVSMNDQISSPTSSSLQSPTYRTSSVFDDAETSTDTSGTGRPTVTIQRPRPVSTSTTGSSSTTGSGGSSSALVSSSRKQTVTPSIPPPNANGLAQAGVGTARMEDSPFGDHHRALPQPRHDEYPHHPSSPIDPRIPPNEIRSKSDKARGKERAWEVDFGASGYAVGESEAGGQQLDSPQNDDAEERRRRDGRALHSQPQFNRPSARNRSDGSSFSTVQGDDETGQGRDRSGTITSAGPSEQARARRGEWQRVVSNDGAGEQEYPSSKITGLVNGDGDLGSRSNVRESTIRAVPQLSSNGDGHGKGTARRNGDWYQGRPSDGPEAMSFEEIRAERKRSVKYSGGRSFGSGGGNGPRLGNNGPSGMGGGRYQGGSLGSMEEGSAATGDRAGGQPGPEGGDVEKGVVQGDGHIGQYPPISEQEAEEKAIQENLARLAARDLARRRAARTSRLFNSGPAPIPPASPTSSTTSNNTPNGPTGFSNTVMVGGGSASSGLSGLSKRSTLLGGLLGRLGSYGSADGSGNVDEEMGRKSKRDSEIPLTAHAALYSPGSLLPIDSTPTSRPPSANPFEVTPLELTRSVTPTSPFRESHHRLQPGIDSISSGPGPVMRSSGLPLADGRERRAYETDFGSSMLSAGRNPFGTSSTHGSNDGTFEARSMPDEEDKRSWESGLGTTEPGWKGSGWRGGAGEVQARGGDVGYATAQMVPKQEKWWSALCAWGDDLDEGAENAGRTNPNE